MSAELFRKLALTSGALPRSSKPKSLSAALSSEFAEEAKELTTQFHDVQTFGWLIGSTIASSRLGLRDINGSAIAHFCRAWGHVAKPHDGKIHINERRFNRWLSITDWEMFYQETLKAIDMMSTYKSPFSLSSLYEIAQRRDETMHSMDSGVIQQPFERFNVIATDYFIAGQNI